MKTRNFWIATLGGAILSLLATNLPYIGLVNCVLCSAFWGSAVFSTWLYRRLSGNLTISDGLRIGAMTGLFAGVIGLLLSFFGAAGLQWLLKDVYTVLPIDTQKSVTEIPAPGWFIINLIGVLGEVVFGVIGGWIGTAIFRTDRLQVKEGETK